ncbi:hypothetical protein IV203_026236 [Nitzschia inconspicua]|uniref:Uncharacterized protein n=1 Tax=Nitzschia inconspicua TaxID=303405 RepID=A0A9K3PXD6_9STRA|nr:hypothetical protein IV203_026236 [Nitzschia inconspicua]
MKWRRQSDTMRNLLLLGILLWIPTRAQESSSFHCSICKDGGTIGNPNGLVNSVSGQSTRCADLQQAVSQLPERSCGNIQSLAMVPCECPGFDDTSPPTMDTIRAGDEEEPFVCSICGEGEMTNPTGLVLNAAGRPTTCQALHDARQSISEGACATIQTFARQPCGCTDEPMAINDGNWTDTPPFVCSICGEGGQMTNPDGVVVNNRGQERSCSALEASVEMIPQSTCASVQEMARVPCGCTNPGFTTTVEQDEIPFRCNVCGDGSVMTNPQGTVSPTPDQTLRCGALEANAESIPQNACSTIQGLARDACGCTEPEISQSNATDMFEIADGEDDTPYECSICQGGEMTMPGGIVTSRQGNTARCDVLLSNAHTIPQSACANIQALAMEPCGCVSPSDTNSSMVDRCHICGQGEMTNPTGVVTTPQGQSAQCSALEANSISIPLDRCSNIQALAYEPCGCAMPPEDTADSTVCNVCGEGRQVGGGGKMVTTSLGVFTCSGAERAGLMGNIPLDHCDSVSISVQQACGCYVDGPTAAPSPEPFRCSICGEGLVVTSPEVTLDIQGVNEPVTCGEYEAAGMNGSVNESQCPVLQDAASQVCGCSEPPPPPTQSPTVYRCPICGEGRVIGRPMAEVVLPNTQRMSCRGLEQRSQLGVIQEQQCRQIQPFVKETCGCVDEAPLEPTEAPTVFECNICGDDMRVTNPNGVVVIPTQPDRTCAQLLHAASIGNINPNQCQLLHPFVYSPCGCTVEDSVAPSDTPSSFPTAPTFSPAPSTIMMRDDCFADLGEIYEMEKSVEDTSVKRKYVLCPGRTFRMGVWTDGGDIKDGEPFLALRPNVVYQCGEDGSRFNNCVLKGGDFGLASYYGVFEGIFETVPGVEIHGLTFESQNLFSVLLQAAGDITFTGCAFKGNNNNAPVLIQWGGEGPENFNIPISRALEAVFTNERSLQDDTLKHTVTFQDCVFRDNYVDSSMSFPGIIENSFKSELVISNCLFQNNIYGDDQNPASYGYAVRSFGPLSMDSSCFIGNTFLNHGPVLVYGNQYTASNNYVESAQTDLTCEFMALFNEQDDRAEEIPSCELSDANTCPFSQAPTESPTQGEETPEPSSTIEDFINDPVPTTPSNVATSASPLQRSGLVAPISIVLAVWFMRLYVQ